MLVTRGLSTKEIEMTVNEAISKRTNPDRTDDGIMYASVFVYCPHGKIEACCPHCEDFDDPFRAICVWGHDDCAKWGDGPCRKPGNKSNYVRRIEY
jgi:hypothetical protein